MLGEMENRKQLLSPASDQSTHISRITDLSWHSEKQGLQTSHRSEAKQRGHHMGLHMCPELTHTGAQPLQTGRQSPGPAEDRKAAMGTLPAAHRKTATKSEGRVSFNLGARWSLQVLT